MVRQATEQDIDQLTAMARDFIGYSAYGTMIEPSDDDIRTGISAIVRSGGMFVAEVEGKRSESTRLNSSHVQPSRMPSSA